MKIQKKNLKLITRESLVAVHTHTHTLIISFNRKENIFLNSNKAYCSSIQQVLLLFLFFMAIDAVNKFYEKIQGGTYEKEKL